MLSKSFHVNVLPCIIHTDMTMKGFSCIQAKVWYTYNRRSWNFGSGSQFQNLTYSAPDANTLFAIYDSEDLKSLQTFYLEQYEKLIEVDWAMLMQCIMLKRSTLLLCSNSGSLKHSSTDDLNSIITSQC